MNVSADRSGNLSMAGTQNEAAPSTITPYTPHTRPPNSTSPNNQDILTRDVEQPLPALSISEQTTNPQYSELDLSKLSFKEVSDKLLQEDGLAWIEKYCQALRKGAVLSMPAMAETTENIHHMIDRCCGDEFTNTEEQSCLRHLQAALCANAERGYPAMPSEQLTLCFLHTFDFIATKKLHNSEENVPAVLANLTMHSLKKIMQLNWVAMTTPGDLADDSHWQNIEQNVPELALEYSYRRSFSTPCLRIITLTEHPSQLLHWSSNATNTIILHPFTDTDSIQDYGLPHAFRQNSFYLYKKEDSTTYNSTQQSLHQQMIGFLIHELMTMLKLEKHDSLSSFMYKSTYRSLDFFDTNPQLLSNCEEITAPLHKEFHQALEQQRTFSAKNVLAQIPKSCFDSRILLSPNALFNRAIGRP